MSFDGDSARRGALVKQVDGGGGAVDSSDLPATLGEPDGVASGTASEVQGFAWRKRGCGFGEQRIGRRFEVLGGAVAGAVAVIPGGDFHEGIFMAGGENGKHSEEKSKRDSSLRSE